MSNPIYKVTVNENVIIDISDTTAVASDVAKEKKFYLADGSLVSGTDNRPSYISAKKITKSGAYTAGENEAWSTVVVDIPYQTKQVTPEPKRQEVVPDDEYEALTKVVVEAIPSDYVKPTKVLTISKNDTYEVKEVKEVIVNVPQGGAEGIEEYNGQVVIE